MTHSPPDSSDERTSRSRYPGIRPFSDSVADGTRFFGRTEESEQLYLRVLSVPLLLQFAKSGLGKTSLLQAGLFPRLRKEPFLPVMVRLNDGDETLTIAVARSIQQACEAERLEHTEGELEGAWELLSTTMVSRGDLMLKPVLVFDQFEEVFTLRDAEFRANLAVEIGALASGNIPERLMPGRPSSPGQLSNRPECKIVITLREDYLGSLEEFSTAIPGLFSERLRLGPLTENAAREAIMKPAVLVAGAGEEPYWSPSFEFEPAVIESMIAYLKGSAGIIEPFQLQLLCRHAEAIARTKHSTGGRSVTLSPADFSGIQDFSTVLKNFYQDTTRKIPSSQRKKAKELCEEGLLDVSGHRLMLEEGQIREEFGIKTDTLTTLSIARLIRRERRLESVFYEISHDRLAESIVASRPAIGKKMRRTLWNIGILALVALAIGAYWVHSIREEKLKAESLLGFLLGERFLDQIRDVGRSSMLEQVRDHVKTYVGANDQGAALIRGLALRNAGDVELTHGFLAKSVTFFEQALTVIESSPDNVDRQREVARTRTRLGEALISQGYTGKALEHYAVAVKVWEQVVTSEAVKVDDCYNFAETLVSAGQLKIRMGKETLAIKDIDKAASIITAVPLGRFGVEISKAIAYPDTKALEVLSRSLMARATIFYDKKGYEAAVRLANEAKKLSPTSKSATTQRATALASLANDKLMDSPKDALAIYRAVLADFDEFRRRDPANRVSEREQAAVQLLIAEGLVACHQDKAKSCESISSLEDAEVTNLNAIVTLSVLAEIDPSNMSLRRDLAWAQQGRAKVLEARGRHVERQSALKESERLHRASIRDSSDVEVVLQLVLILLDQSNALADLDRWPDVKETLQRSISEFRTLENEAGIQGDGLAIVNSLLNARTEESKLLRKARDKRDKRDKKDADLVDLERKRLEAQYNNLYDNLSKISEAARKLKASQEGSVSQGAILFNEGNYAAALSEFKAAESALRAYIDLNPTDYNGYDNLKNVYYWIRAAQRELGFIKAMDAAGRGMLDMARIATILMPHQETDDTMREAQQIIGVSLYDSEHFTEYIEETLNAVQQEVAAAEAKIQKNPNNADYLSKLSQAHFGQGKVRKKAGKVGWKEAIRIGIIYLRKATDIDRKNPVYQNELGYMQKYLADELVADHLKEEAQVEYGIALKAYQQAARLSSGDETALNGIRELQELGFR